MRIVFLSPWFPYPPDNGAKIRVFNFIRNLSQKHELILLSFTQGKPDLTGLKFCSKVLTVEQNPYVKSKFLNFFHFFLPRPGVTYEVKAMAKIVDNVVKGEKPSALLAFTSVVAPYFIRYPQPKILDIDAGLTEYALEHLRLQTGNIGKLRASLSLKKATMFERKMVANYDATVVLTSNSYYALKPVLAKADLVKIIGNGVDINHYTFNKDQFDPYTLVYNGALSFSANYDAMNWFLNDIYPMVKEKAPQVSVKITGRHDTVDITPFTSLPGVIFTGYVKDIRPVVSESCICIVPLRTGSGQRMKILEAMALGTPIVSTSKGIEGLYLVPGEHVLVADQAGDFANAVLQLLGNSELRDALACKARSFVEREYSWENVLPEFDFILERVVNLRNE